MADAKARLAALAAAEGFARVAFAAAGPLAAARARALQAEAAGQLAGLSWMTPAWLRRATDADTFLTGAATVMIVALPYRRAGAAPNDGVARGRVAAYAAGRDYHRVFETKLRRIAATIRAEFGVGARSTVDAGTLLERPFAAQAGLGWLGKSTMLLIPGLGPWALLGAVATKLALEPDGPLKKSCGACTRCIAACPTGAISPDGQLDARLCISYHTIENRGPIPRELRPLFKDWLFGCDDCLTSCPVGATNQESHPDLVAKSLDDAFPPLVDMLSLSEADFAARFVGRAVARAKRDGLARNACIVLGNTGTERDLPALVTALDHEAALVRGHAAWALARLANRLGEGHREAAKAALAARAANEHDHFARDEFEAALADLGPLEPESRTPPWPSPKS